MFRGLYCEIFGRGGRLWYILDLGGRLLHATCGFLNLLVGRYASSHFGSLLAAAGSQPINHCVAPRNFREPQGSLEKA